MSDEAGRLEQSGDEGGLADLYRLYSGWLISRLRKRFGDRADDLAQTAYLKVLPFSRRGEVRHPKALLLRIASRDGLRQDKRDAALPHLVIDMDFGPSAALAADQDEAVLLKQVILSMPPILRDVFVLSRFAHLTYDEIGERLGVSVKTVEWRMSKALAHCAAQLRL